MSSVILPSEVQRRELAEGVRYRLPSAGRAASVSGCGCFLVLVGLPLIAAVEATYYLWLQRQAFGPVELLACLGLGAIYLLSVWWFWQMGLATAGSITVELRRGTLWAGNRLGWWRSGHSLPVERLARLTVFKEPTWRLSVSSAEAAEPSEPSYSLVAESDEKPALILAYHTEAAVLQALGEDLRHHLLASPEAPVSAPGLRQPIPVVDERANGPVPRPEQPLSSRINLEERPDGVMLRLPPTGLKGMADVTWLLCLAAFSVGAPAVLWLRWEGMAWQNLLLEAVLGLYWILALLLLRWSLETRFLPTRVQVDADRLFVRLPRLTGFGRKTWPTRDLTNVFGFANGVQIVKQNDETEDLGLPISDVVEAQWLATVLRRALHLPRPEPTLTEVREPSGP